MKFKRTKFENLYFPCINLQNSNAICAAFSHTGIVCKSRLFLPEIVVVGFFAIVTQTLFGKIFSFVIECYFRLRFRLFWGQNKKQNRELARKVVNYGARPKVLWVKTTVGAKGVRHNKADTIEAAQNQCFLQFVGRMTQVGKYTIAPWPTPISFFCPSLCFNT